MGRLHATQWSEGVGIRVGTWGAGVGVREWGLARPSYIGFSVRIRRWLLVLVAIGAPLCATAAPAWRLTSNNHFQLYSETSDERARTILGWFEQLHAFFDQEGGGGKSISAPVKVMVFSSEAAYQPYRLRTAADAYYVGSKGQDYIVMSGGDPDTFALAAHEYAHLALRDWGLRLPPWLKEGLAEYFATLRIGDHTVEIGGPRLGRMQTLRRRTWMPLADLTAVSDEDQARLERDRTDLFYAESWALSEMLVLSPDYANAFARFIGRVSSGTPGIEALNEVYGKSVEAVTRDLRAWVNQRALPVVRLPEVVAEAAPVQVTELSPFAARLTLAQLLLAVGEFDRAEAAFEALAKEWPDSADVPAALGSVALHRGNAEGARRAWKRAIELGVSDAELCYQYATLADEAGLSADDIRPALQRAITLRPDFDDAHYQLALLEKNARHYEAAIAEFQAMRRIPEKRALDYWLSLADAFNEMDRRDEAISAARHAAEFARTAAQRKRVADEIHLAQTDLNVRFARDAAGNLQLVATRTPHGQPDWNPFIEAGDEMHRAEGMLRAIHCGSVTTIVVEASGKLLTLAIPDLKHVEMRHAPADFVCGEQAQPIPVTVDYAHVTSAGAAGIVRGMDFR